MADNKNNKTGALGPDGYDDVTGKKVEQPAIVLTEPGTPVGPGLLMEDPTADIDPALLALVQQQAAALGVNQQTAQPRPGEFQVNIGLSRTQSDGTTTMAGFSPYNTVHYGMDSTIEAGYLGIKDPRLSALVEQASGGKIELYDSVYKNAVMQAAYYQKMGKNITVADILRNPQRYKIGPYDPSGSGPSGYTGPVTTRQRSVSLTSATAANRLIDTALQGYLGREATTVEKERFLKALNVQERANPSISTTVQDMNDEGSYQTISRTDRGGFDQAEFADRFAKSQEGYAEYQASTTYLDAFIGALENKSRVI